MLSRPIASAAFHAVRRSSTEPSCGCSCTPTWKFAMPGTLPVVAGVPHAVATGLGEEADAVWSGADLERLDEVPGRGVDHVHRGVVATAKPELAAVGRDATHVGAATDVPRRVDGVGGEVEHRDGAGEPVAHVHLGAVPTR